MYYFITQYGGKVEDWGYEGQNRAAAGVRLPIDVVYLIFILSK